MTVGREVCTASYAAPEMWGCEGKGDIERKLGTVYGYQVDVWTIGCVLFELQLCEVFGAGKTREERLRTVAERIGNPPETLVKALTKDAGITLTQVSTHTAASVEKHWASGGDFARWLRDNVLIWDAQGRLPAKSMAVELERRQRGDAAAQAMTIGGGVGGVSDICASVPDPGVLGREVCLQPPAVLATPTPRRPWLQAFSEHSGTSGTQQTIMPLTGPKQKRPRSVYVEVKPDSKRIKGPHVPMQPPLRRAEPPTTRLQVGSHARGAILRAVCVFGAWMPLYWERVTVVSSRSRCCWENAVGLEGRITCQRRVGQHDAVRS